MAKLHPHRKPQPGGVCRRIGGALALLCLLVILPDVASAEFWREKDWKDHDHKLTVCVKTDHCYAGFADSVKAAVDLWNAENLTWVLEWKDTDCAGADIVVGCENLPADEQGVARSNYMPGTATVDHVDIAIKNNSTYPWGFCNGSFEIVAVLSHELGHAMRLKDLPSAKQDRIMRGEQRFAGHIRGPSREDSLEARASDTCTVITTTTTPHAKEKQTGGGGTITPAPGMWPFDFQRAVDIQLRAYDPLNLQFLNYQPTGPNTLAWQGFVSATEASMELYHLVITYPESTSVREGLLYVTDTAFQPEWAPDAVAPADTTVAYDTDRVILYPYLSGHPAGDVVAYRWIIDDAFDLEGQGGEVSTTLSTGLHQVVMLAEDQAGTQDRDTMQVTVLAPGADVAPGSGPGALRLHFPSPYRARMGAGLVIEYELTVPDAVTLTMYDTQGHIVRALRSAEPTERGSHRVTWDLRYRSGMLAPPGTYFCALRAGGETTVRKLVILR